MKEMRKYSLLVLMLLVLVGCGPNYEARIEEAEQLLVENKIEEAEEIYYELIEEYPEKNPAYIKLGELAMLESEYEKAISYFDRAPEESLDLAVNLFKIARLTDDKALANEVYNNYKNHESIGQEAGLYEAALEAYINFEDMEKIDSLIDRLVELDIKLDVEILVESYNFLRDMGMEHIANSMIENEIYDREEADLSLVADKLEDIDNKTYMNLTTGYFIDADRLDIAILYGLDYQDMDAQEEILLFNGENGELISSYSDKSINEYMRIGSFDRTGDRDDIIYREGHSGGTGTPNSIIFYETVDGQLNRRLYNVEEDFQINFLDNFEYEIGSEKLDIKYQHDLDEADIPYYIDNSYYSNQGKYIAAGYGLGAGMGHEYVVKTELGPDRLINVMGLEDNMDNRKFLAMIHRLYEIRDGKLELVDLYLEDLDGELMEYDKRSSKDHQQVESQSKGTNREGLLELVGEYLPLFNETANTVIKNYGQPSDVGDWQMTYYDYGEFLVFLNEYEPDQAVSSVWIRGFLGLENSQEAIIERFGQPDDAGKETEADGYYMTYELEGYQVIFSSIGSEYPSIEIRR